MQVGESRFARARALQQMPVTVHLYRRFSTGQFWGYAARVAGSAAICGWAYH